MSAPSGLTASGAAGSPPPEWLTSFYAKVDALDLEAVVAGFAPDASMCFGANPPLAGAEAIRAGLSGLFSVLDSMRHRFRRVWLSGDTTLLEATVTYHRSDGEVVPIPVLTIIDRTGELISDMRVYIDQVPMSH